MEQHWRWEIINDPKKAVWLAFRDKIVHKMKIQYKLNPKKYRIVRLDEFLIYVLNLNLFKSIQNI